MKRPELWRAWHDVRLCGGALSAVYTDNSDEVTLVCMCGYVEALTLLDLVNGRSLPCEVCALPSRTATCADCQRVAQEFGAIVAVFKDAVLTR